MLFYIGLGIGIVLAAVYCWVAIKKAYDKGETLPRYVAIAIWTMDTSHFLLVTWASLYSVWILPFNKTIASIAGLVATVIGLVVMLAGIIEFRSLRKMSGMDVSRFITTGTYRYSRNPQYFGWFAMLFGISLMGRSGLAFLLTIVFVIGIHLYTIWLEEPFLERIFGDEYRLYKSRTPRYAGIPKEGREKCKA